MNTIIDKLAEALRAAMNESEDVPAGFDVDGGAWYARAHRVLAEYEAQRQAGEPVAWQSRARSDRPLGDAGWMWIERAGYMRHPEHFDYRALYAGPPSLCPPRPAPAAEAAPQGGDAVAVLRDFFDAFMQNNGTGESTRRLHAARDRAQAFLAAAPAQAGEGGAS